MIKSYYFNKFILFIQPNTIAIMATMNQSISIIRLISIVYNCTIFYTDLELLI